MVKNFVADLISGVRKHTLFERLPFPRTQNNNIGYINYTADKCERSPKVPWLKFCQAVPISYGIGSRKSRSKLE